MNEKAFEVEIKNINDRLNRTDIQRDNEREIIHKKVDNRMIEIKNFIKEVKTELEGEIKETEGRMSTQITQGFEGIKDQVGNVNKFKDKLLVGVISGLGFIVLGLFTFIVTNLDKIFK